jgi:hypothetical protein
MSTTNLATSQKGQIGARVSKLFLQNEPVHRSEHSLKNIVMALHVLLRS